MRVDGCGDGALLAIGGGETLFDYHEYREAWWGDAARLGLQVHEGPPGAVPDGADVAILGTIEDDEMAALYGHRTRWRSRPRGRGSGWWSSKRLHRAFRRW